MPAKKWLNIQLIYAALWRKAFLNSLWEWVSLESKDKKNYHYSLRCVFDIAWSVKTQLFILAAVSAGGALQTTQQLFAMHHFRSKSWGLLWVAVRLIMMHLWAEIRNALSSHVFIRNHTSAIRHYIKYLMKDTIAHKYVNWERTSEWMNEKKLSSTAAWHTWLTKELIWSPGLGLITALISKLLRAVSHPAATTNGTQHHQTGWPGREQIKWDLIDGSLTS